MEKVIIYGTGMLGYYVGKQLLNHQLNPQYEILCYCSESNQPQEPINGYDVITVEQLGHQNQDVTILLAVPESQQALMTFLELGYKKICYVTGQNRFLKHVIFPEAVDVDYGQFPKIVSEEPVRFKKILYVQEFLCTRTEKISRLMKKQGVEVDFAYHSRVPDEHMTSHFGRVFHIDSIAEFLSYVNASDYDLVHVSNERDFLCALCCTTNKPIVHDCHDAASVEFDISSPDAALEYLANQQSDGRIYVSEGQRAYILSQLETNLAPTLILGNLMSETLFPATYHEKLSATDGRLHCVYEGGLWPDPSSVRFLEKMFLQIAQAGAVIHFYTQDVPKFASYYQGLMELHPNIIWERYCPSHLLAEEMTKYDVGMFLLHLENSSLKYSIYTSQFVANKQFDYLVSALPTVYNIPAMSKGFYGQHPVGQFLDFAKPIFGQLKKASLIPIDRDYIREHNLTIESRVHDIIAFYRQVILHKCEKLHQ